MKINRNILLIAGLVVMSSMQVFAQEDDKYQKQKDQDAINTKKKTPTKIIEFIVGEWEAEEVYQGKKEVSGTDTVAQVQLFEFNREGKYFQYTGNEKIDSGSYRLNEQDAILYLESAEYDAPTSGWRISFSEDGKMFLRKIDDTEHAESYKYVYRRKTN